MAVKTKKTVQGFKAFNADLKCQDFQYELGKTYEHKGELVLCPSSDDVQQGKGGFHFCKFPLAIFNYYNLIGSRFAEVEAEDGLEDEDKTVTAKLTIKKEIGIADLIKAQISLVFSFCFTKDKPAESSKVTASDERFAQLASSGDGAQLASSGYGAQLASSGDGAKLVSKGKNSAIAAVGINSTAAGVEGNWLTLAEWKYDGIHWQLVCVKTEQVDGKRIKAGQLYKLVEGEFTVV
ncbi:MAG TPA: hypothetical protein VGO57_09540 [Verrucomicrobiae bacterium]